MVVKEFETDEDLVIGRKILDEANLGRRLRLVVKRGEIRIVQTPVDPEKALEELAGCLGQEPAAEYDFHLKIGGLYEAR
ncbi:MAG: hypothetical protein FJ123_07670 [Deltaproteobacteria bacterium]|nr:hypothetical protein [Deltaproteobacteria bacterium]